MKIPLLRFAVDVPSALLAMQFLAIDVFAQTGPTLPGPITNPTPLPPNTTITSSGNVTVLTVSGNGSSLTAEGLKVVTIPPSSPSFLVLINFHGALTMNGGTIENAGTGIAAVQVGSANGLTSQLASFATLNNVDFTTVGNGLSVIRIGSIADYTGGTITKTGNGGQAF